MSTICGADCSVCPMKANCKGCLATGGHPFGGSCITAECYKNGGKECFCEFKAQLIRDFNALDIPDMPEVTELYPLCGAYINMEYTLPNGEKIKLLSDKDIYLGNQAEKENGSRCYGLAADEKYLLVCEYGAGGDNPEIIVYKKRLQ